MRWLVKNFGKCSIKTVQRLVRDASREINETKTKICTEHKQKAELFTLIQKFDYNRWRLAEQALHEVKNWSLTPCANIKQI